MIHKYRQACELLFFSFEKYLSKLVTDEYNIRFKNIIYAGKERIVVKCESRFLGTFLVKIDSIYNISYFKWIKFLI